jgi:hypothetical protein
VSRSTFVRFIHAVADPDQETPLVLDDDCGLGRGGVRGDFLLRGPQRPSARPDRGGDLG